MPAQIKLFLSLYTCHTQILALTKCRVHFDWKRNVVFSSACNCHVKGFQTGPLKVTSRAVEHCTLDRWRVHPLLNETFQLALSVPAVVAHNFLVHLQKRFKEYIQYTQVTQYTD